MPAGPSTAGAEGARAGRLRRGKGQACDRSMKLVLRQRRCRRPRRQRLPWLTKRGCRIIAGWSGPCPSVIGAGAWAGERGGAQPQRAEVRTVRAGLLAGTLHPAPIDQRSRRSCARRAPISRPLSSQCRCTCANPRRSAGQSHCLVWPCAATRSGAGGLIFPKAPDLQRGFPVGTVERCRDEARKGQVWQRGVSACLPSRRPASCHRRLLHHRCFRLKGRRPP